MDPSVRPSATVLVVDDNEANRLLAQATLEDEAYRVILATNGPDAITAFERSAPDCVLLDVRMPGMDGFEVCKRIRALPGGRRAPILFLTALRDVDTFDEALAAGGDDFLSKPVRPAELLVRVQASLELRRLGSELGDHVDLLKRQRDDLLRLQLQKERLMAFVVHDLKNPVTTMDLHAQVLLREPGLPPDALESVQHIRDAARTLNRMIMNLLDLSKADEGKLTPKRRPFALRPLLDEIAGELAADACAKRVELEVASEVETTFADEDLLRRTLSNLVENGLRHAPLETTVTVVASRSPNGIVLRVMDRGRGVPAELRERVFEPFMQLDAEAPTSRGGRGLGLAFCKQAVIAHEGRIWVEDAGPGAVFCVELPGEP